VADDGLVYQLEPGISYRLVVSGTGHGNDNSAESGGSSDTLIGSGGIYVTSGEMVLVTYAEPVSSDSISAWAVARKGSVPQVGVRVDFALLDIFGNPVNIQGIPNNPFQLTGIDGRADATFIGLPYGKYIVRTRAADSQYVGYSREVEFLPPSSGGGGGCASSSGIFAVLFAAGTACVCKIRQAWK
jgi:hypothetical protein